MAYEEEAKEFEAALGIAASKIKDPKLRSAFEKKIQDVKEGFNLWKANTESFVSKAAQMLDAFAKTGKFVDKDIDDLKKLGEQTALGADALLLRIQQTETFLPALKETPWRKDSAAFAVWAGMALNFDKMAIASVESCKGLAKPDAQKAGILEAMRRISSPFQKISLITRNIKK